MRIKTHEKNGIVEVIIDGNVLQENVSIFKSRLNDLIENGQNQIVLNMVSVNYISSLCLAVIVDAKNRLIAINGDLKIALVNRLILNLLEITNLSKKIEIYDSIEEAINAFSN